MISRIFLVAALFCCTASAGEFVSIAPDQKGFVLHDKPFTPWGFNYDRDYKMRLIEDYWDGEWPTIEGDFAEMKRLGANVVRIHISVGKFMSASDRPIDHALDQLERLTKLAEANGLYLDITGLGCYRKADVPAWYDALDEQHRWDAQANFWAAIAKRLKDRPGVMAYDLINEPEVPHEPRKAGEWIDPYSKLADFYYCQLITLDAAGRPRAQIARQWAHQLASAIRKVDPNHLVTIGFLPNSVGGDTKRTSGFDPSVVGNELDYISVHIYPDHKNLDDAQDLVRAFQVGKPLVIEEMFPLACSADELGQFIERARPNACGWIGFYWGQTPDELRGSKQLGDAFMLAWLELFQTANPNHAN